MANWRGCPCFPKPPKGTALNNRNSYTNVYNSIIRPNVSYAQAANPNKISTNFNSQNKQPMAPKGPVNSAQIEANRNPPANNRSIPNFNNKSNNNFNGYNFNAVLKNKRSQIPTLNCATGMAVTDPQKANLLANTIKNNFIENNRMQDNYDQDDEVVTSATNRKYFGRFPKKEEHGSGLSGYPESLRPCLDFRLTFKLITYDIPSPLIHLIHSYLTNRSFRIRVNESLSNSHSISAGCPQGSLLGPLLFNLYINDIPSYSLTNISLYADDTAINATYKNLKTVTFAINKHLKLLENYYDRWKISINVEKSCAVIFTKKRTIPPLS
ncbi:probable RNA-directed DNA polymerase from transposon X-element [Trichonephila clavipes]|nr:probable RNA-directed DNA polymerase from transposon X-element [Trichonephila clavipes]